MFSSSYGILYMIMADLWLLLNHSNHSHVVNGDTHDECVCYREIFAFAQQYNSVILIIIIYTYICSFMACILSSTRPEYRQSLMQSTFVFVWFLLS